MSQPTTTLDCLAERLQQLDSVLIAFSGGCDSTLLAAVAGRTLGTRALAVTVHSAFTAEAELQRARQLAESLGIRHRIVEADVLAIPTVRDNPPDRCYHCKRMIFERLKQIAIEENLAVVCDGTNVDDHNDYRPGRRALRELGIVSPLEDCGFRKADIRRLSKELGLASWNLPAAACLASRVPSGRPLTASVLRQIEAAESALAEMGYDAFRVRHHNEIARLEMSPEDFPRAVAERETIASRLHHCGYRFVCLDLDGYRTGSLNPIPPNA